MRPARSAGDHFIPIRQAELVDLLASQPDLKAQEVDLFRRLAQILSATVHHEYQQELEALKADYAPFDPDSDTVSVGAVGVAKALDALDGSVRSSGETSRAGQFHLFVARRDRASPGRRKPVGVESDRRFRSFRSLGNLCPRPGNRARQVRSLSTRFRKVESDAETFQRLVVMLKLRPHRSLPKGVDNDDVYLKLFKDIPRMDLEMLLPGTQIKMSLFDRTKIVLPTVSGMALTGWKVITGAMVVAASGMYNTLALVGLAGGTSAMVCGRSAATCKPRSAINSA